jgi:hypothetical protein
MKRSILSILLPAVLLGACDPRSVRAVDTEVAAARAEIARNACIAAALTQRAHDNLETLQSFVGDGFDGTPAAALQFARAYAHHAELRQAVAARVDSAVNHARSPADSARHADAAIRFIPAPPEPGTLEDNVATAYNRDFRTVRADEDHRCNWAL